ncbi:NAD(+) diphosphatase [Temperatibacter marinus]|uniref:NAD(+) diphosphatase n=1 Tax=Temperatibacter marinus TaxID=1456591 RepID=A0AA52H9N1_9PROT|nr:NAD(+) diphosphatase [Temperatibacter marinus]WND03366.1 NAD(+) diphosphatase [Temperatibacter marinus]
MSDLLNANQIHIMFAGNPLNRMDNYRPDSQLDEKWRSHPDSKIILTWRDKVAITSDYKIKWHSKADLQTYEHEQAVFLGMDQNDTPYYATALVEENDAIKFKDLRSLAFNATAGDEELAMAAQGKSMLDWHRSHAYCGKCGEQSTMRKMGYERKCSACDSSHFPRTDPVVIMLGVHLETDSILVGRPHNLFEGVYTALAGFMEPGESIEEATARELHEEAGVKVTKVHYVASQPWPYPSTLMIGCIAEIESKDLEIDHEELDDARWFSRKEAQEIMDGKKENLMFPPPLAIARQLLEFWLSSKSSI